MAPELQFYGEQTNRTAANSGSEPETQLGPFPRRERSDSKSIEEAKGEAPKVTTALASSQDEGVHHPGIMQFVVGPVVTKAMEHLRA